MGGEKKERLQQALIRVARKISPERIPMPESSKEELMARVAELEKQVGSKKPGSLEFKVSEKGGVSVYGWGDYEQRVRLLDSTDGLSLLI
jgi:hypothetical protein